MPKAIPTFKPLALILALLTASCATKTTPAPTSRASGKDLTYVYFEDNRLDAELMKKISALLAECERIKRGMPRAEVSKNFMADGGINDYAHQRYVSRTCTVIKIDIDLTLVGATPSGLEERPQDIVKAVSKPYLEHMNLD